MSEFKQVVQDGAKTVGKRIRRILLWVLLIAVLGTAAYIGACNLTYSKGQRAGLLNKVSYKGVVWKTYEGELNMGSFDTDEVSGVIGNTWKFSVWKDAVYEQLQDYQGQQVKLFYRQKFKVMPWQGKTDYFVYKVEIVQKIDN
jgi:hypothetical protein